MEVIVIPDVHGRDFWRGPVMDNIDKDDTKIVFLGDYVDPYPHEWNERIEDVRNKTIEMLEEIINLKSQYPEKITLLFGNHDATYLISREICQARTDYDNFPKLKEIYTNNKDKFLLGDECHINDKHFIFTHAGISKAFVKTMFDNEFQIGGECTNEHNVISRLNGFYQQIMIKAKEPYSEDDLAYRDLFIQLLGLYSYYRGYTPYDFGSPIWADVREWGSQEFIGGYQVFGHTMLKKPIITHDFACLDCQECFKIDEKGDISKI